MIFARAGRSSNGRTIASEAVYLGSNPSLPALAEILNLIILILVLFGGNILNKAIGRMRVLLSKGRYHNS
jgi:hypothetical protein